MKTPSRVLPLIYMAAAVHASAAHYQVYLLGGQSNGNGRADAAQLTPPLSEEQADVRLYYRNLQDGNSVLPEDQWINLAPGSGHGTTLYYDTEFGPEVSFGRSMADAKPSENIAIIKYTYGGTNLYNHWSATGTQYANFVSTVQAGFAALTAAGHTHVLRGMLWQQGEADTGGSAADSYEANLTNLISRVRADLNGGVAFPFVIGSLSDSQYSNITTVGSGPYKVRQAQEAVAAADATVGIAISDGYGIQTDGIHFDHVGQVALGQSHAVQMLALEGPDATAPVLGSREPAGASTAAVDANLVATFNEPITLVSGGTVTLRDLGPGSDVVIMIPDVRLAVSGSGNQLVINPATDLVAANPYAVRISANAVEDLSGNPFAGIGDDETWAFSVGNATTVSLVHHWPLDGTALDSGSTGGHDGAAQGDAAYTSSSGGAFGNAVSLDGDGDSILVNQSSLPATNFTLSAWVRPDSVSGFTYVAGTQQSGTLGAFLRVDEGAGGDGFAFFNLLPPADPRKAFGGTVPVGSWTHLAATVDGTNGLTVFVNGSPVASDPAGVDHSPHTNFRIGARPDNGANNGFDGLIDDVAIFDGVLDSTQLGNVIAYGAANFDGVVADNAPPVVLALAPGDGDLTAAVDADLVITFNEPVEKGGSGDIVIKEDGGSIFETIPVTGAQVGISGSAVTINPSGTLAPNRVYHVRISTGAIEDLSGNAWVGIADTDAGVWKFATAETVAGTTGIFDENADATNELDIEIPAATLGVFKTAVLDAYNSDLGGVIDWETGVTATSSTGSTAGNSVTGVAAAYGAGGGEVVVLAFDRAMDLYTNDINGQVEALSRQGAWHNALIPGGGNDPIGLGYGVGFSGADIVRIGMAIPSRSTYGTLGVDFRATAAYSGGGSGVVDFTVGGTPGTGDTFVHFAAPAGEAITSVSVEYVDDNGQSLANGQRRPVLDDLGFVVAAPSGTFATWVSDPAFGLDPANRGFSDDPDGDGLVNGIEAWLGTHPGEFSRCFTSFVTDGTVTTFTHPQNENIPGDVDGYYEWSPNLVDWYACDGSDGPEGGPAVNITASGTAATTTTVTIAASEHMERLFLRAGVTRN